MPNDEELPVLVGQAGPLKGLRFPINGAVVLGREPGCEVMISSRQVSRYHARLTTSSEGIILEDLGSKNGTHYNGNPLASPVVLKDGDLFQIALVQEFMFLSSDATMPLTEPLAQQGMLMLDMRSRRVWVNNQQLVPPLSALQFHMLWVLYEKQGQVVSRQDLVSAVWGDEQSAGVSDQALDALIRRLRDRISALDPMHPYIVTVRGHGLRLDNPPSK
jgi:DNA-binding winged helix-turn-helix (wHTH) protein